MPWISDGDAGDRYVYGRNKCYACDGLLEPVFDTTDTVDGVSPEDQYLDAVEVKFHGGYGMLIDEEFSSEFSHPDHPWYHPDAPTAPQVLICKDCAVELMATVPWIKRMLSPHVG